MAAALLVFGASLGLIETGMNVHAVEVEKRAGCPLISGFHGLFSVGGFAGSLSLTAVLSAKASPITGTVAASGLMLAALIVAVPRLVATPKAEDTSLFVMPRGVVAVLAGITFLSKGAMLDWSALLLSGRNLLPITQAGIGYSVFAVAMTAGRLSGDTIVARLGDMRTMVWGGLLAITGYAVILLVPFASVYCWAFPLSGLAPPTPCRSYSAGPERRPACLPASQSRQSLRSAMPVFSQGLPAWVSLHRELDCQQRSGCWPRCSAPFRSALGLLHPAVKKTKCEVLTPQLLSSCDRKHEAVPNPVGLCCFTSEAKAWKVRRWGRCRRSAFRRTAIRLPADTRSRCRIRPDVRC